MKDYSPFTPGNPVSKELFVGRKAQIDEMIRYGIQTAAGRLENVFLSGDRGIGKSSLASVLKNFLETEEQFLGIHIFLGGVHEVDELVRRIFESIIKESHKKKWYEKISSSFGNYIEKVGVIGVDVTFKPRDKIDEIVKNFPTALHTIVQNIKENKKAIFIILDDINGICKNQVFANWYKSFVDTVATHHENFPIYMMLIGLPEVRDALSENQPSLLRVFRVIEIERLSDLEVSEFFRKAFETVGVTVNEEAMVIITRFSNGLPILMHEIGDAAFWNLGDNNIVTKDIAMNAVVEAADRIGKKYLDPKVYRAVRSEHYRSILRKIGEDLRPGFSKQDITRKLKEKEKKVFNNFLKRMMDLDIIVKDIESGRGNYKFVNDLYSIYIWLESENFKKTKVTKTIN